MASEFNADDILERFDQQPQSDDAEKFYKLKWSRVQLELASDTVKQMAEFLDKSIEKLGKQKEKGEKKLEKEKKKVEKAENQNIILQERITELESQLQKINTKNKQIKKETDDKYSKLLEEAIAQMNEKFEILAEENDRLNDILSSSSEKS